MPWFFGRLMRRRRNDDALSFFCTTVAFLHNDRLFMARHIKYEENCFSRWTVLSSVHSWFLLMYEVKTFLEVASALKLLFCIPLSPSLGGSVSWPRTRVGRWKYGFHSISFWSLSTSQKKGKNTFLNLNVIVKYLILVLWILTWCLSMCFRCHCFWTSSLGYVNQLCMTASWHFCKSFVIMIFLWKCLVEILQIGNFEFFLNRLNWLENWMMHTRKSEVLMTLVVIILNNLYWRCFIMSAYSFVWWNVLAYNVAGTTSLQY